MKPTVLIFFHRQTRHVYVYIATHDCGGTVIMNGDMSGYTCLKCGAHGPFLQAMATEKVINGMKEVRANPKDWQPDEWDWNDFESNADKFGVTIVDK